ncbi:glycosyltransferase family 39 protein [Candidatus Albibeggiatoa sp. nov. NOAA]|uniref:glycosyltransferase family 39 protein n=1 Tax=Candidatus Albibeggiatoa sp. nov. NOAA TaxID=3162724 RepID=UPI0032FC0848|nr:glycosyltransferase family 39 protein [Thiotrichaceae bacterium]
MTHKLVFWVVFFSVIVFSFLVRMLHIESGLPYIHYWDEPQTASTALHMLKTGDRNPHFFNYGTFLIYMNYFVDIFHYLYLMGKSETNGVYLTDINNIIINKDTGWHWTISHPSFYYWNRMVTVVFGTLTVIFTYLIANNIFKNQWLGILAAAFLGVLSYHIMLSSIIATDVPVAFLVITSIYFTLLFFDSGKTQDLTMSLVFCGLAAATKYNSAIVILLPTIVVCMQFFRKSYRFSIFWFLLLPIIPFITFLIAMPYAFLDSVEFLKDVGYEIRHYKVLGHLNHSSEPGLEHILFQFQQFYTHIGVINLVFIGIGLFSLFRYPKLILVLLIPAIYFLYMTQMTVNFHRNLIQIYPFLAILFAASFLVLHDVFKWIITKLPFFKIKLIFYTLLVMFIGQILSMAVPSLTTAVNAKMSIETRTQAILELNRLNPSSEKIVIAQELRIHKHDLNQLNSPYHVASMQEIHDCQVLTEKDMLVLLPASLKSRRNRHGAELKVGQDLLHKLEYHIIMHIGEDSPLYLDILSINPSMVVVRISKNSLYHCSQK